MSFVLVFDIPSSLRTERRQIYRELIRHGCQMVQDSLWKSDNLKFLIEIGIRIRKIGGKATILEEKILF